MVLGGVVVRLVIQLWNFPSHPVRLGDGTRANGYGGEPGCALPTAVDHGL